jgi:hypothetical protein
LEQSIAERAILNAVSNTTDLFEIIRTTRSMRRLKPDPVPNDLIRKILEAGVCCAQRRKYAAVAVLGHPTAKSKKRSGPYYKRAWDE